MTGKPINEKILTAFLAMFKLLAIDPTTDIKKLREHFNQMVAAFGALKQREITIERFIELYPGLKPLEKTEFKVIEASVRLLGAYVKIYSVEINKRRMLDTRVSSGDSDVNS